MATSDTHVQESSVRRIRSAGDIPRFPERVHIQSGLRISDSTPSPHDAQPSFNQTLTTHAPTLDRLRLPINPPIVQQPGLPAPSISVGNNDRGTGQTNQIPPPPAAPAARNQDQPTRRHSSLLGRFLLYFGLGRGASHARKAWVSLIWTICWDTTQFIIIVTVLSLTSTVFKSPTQPHLSEWKACDRPLGAWASIWLIRLALALCLAYWEFRRDRILHPPNADPEAVNTNVQPGDRTIPQQNSSTRRFQNDHRRPDATAAAAAAAEAAALPYSRTYSRLTVLSSLLTLTWFLTAHILEYSSVNTCRHSSPHLWWLVFGILCIMYFMVLEVVLLGLIVLVIAPIIFICWNIFLICIGRHPFQNPNMIKPDIGKLPKSVVERIPLVMYIPPPPEDEKSTVTTPHGHAYPPTTPSKPTHKRFKLLRTISSFGAKKQEGKDAASEKQDETVAENQGPISWEDNWEQSDYPFVALEGNRAACAICLMDFEEPKRKHPLDGDKVDGTDKANGTETAGTKETDTVPDPLTASSSSSPTQLASISEEGRNGQMPKLTDAGDGAQPLRLLACGHVFHKTCLDPWLIDVSGRCPVCQRAVEVPKKGKSSRQRTETPS